MWKMEGKEGKQNGTGNGGSKSNKVFARRATNFRDLGIAFRRLERSRCSQRFFKKLGASLLYHTSSGSLLLNRSQSIRWQNDLCTYCKEGTIAVCLFDIHPKQLKNSSAKCTENKNSYR
jgi:hypothetical protein